MTDASKLALYAICLQLNPNEPYRALMLWDQAMTELTRRREHSVTHASLERIIELNQTLPRL